MEEALKHAQYIRQAIDKLAATKETAVLRALGVDLAESDCDTSSDESTDEDEDEQLELGNLSPNHADSGSCLQLSNNIPDVIELF